MVQTLEPPRASGFDAIDPPDPELALDCVHCGLCLPTCPTYLVLGNEMDSPRGRIYLIRGALEGRAGLTPTFIRHMELCLVCRACETACPSGVRFGPLMEAARGQIARLAPPAGGQRLFRRFLYGIFPYPARLAALLLPLGWYQRLGLQALVRRSGLLDRLSPRLAQMEALLPRIDRVKLRSALPEVTPAAGPRRGRVGLLSGCVQRLLFHAVNAATIRVLAAHGYEVVVPRGQGCCGALHLHGGERAGARALARACLEAFEAAAVDFVVTNAAGCGSTLKEYGELLRGEGRLGERAAAFGRTARDVSQVLAAAPRSDGQVGRLDLTVTYHEPCHLAHGQRVRQEPRQLLRAIPGLRLVELPEADLCCGSAGVYNLTQPEVALRLLERKIEHVARTKADVVASGNPGCLLQLSLGLRRAGLAARAVHPVELLDWAYRGGTAAPAPWAV
jgi:glycolate oxidase iron-sulfur subunit